jgi:uracil-DNA glycosylase family 4
VLIGEQPGDAEDQAGEPFVGPAGKLLDRALADAGISPKVTYTTNAVKHFRWKPEPRGGKRRIHERPDTWQVKACWPWLAAQLSRLQPSVVVTLGATAGQALFGSSFKVTSEHGTQISWPAPGRAEGRTRQVTVVPTIHPSAVLRADDRDAAYAGWSATCAPPRPRSAGAKPGSGPGFKRRPNFHDHEAGLGRQPQAPERPTPGSVITPMRASEIPPKSSPAVRSAIRVNARLLSVVWLVPSRPASES